VDEAKIAAGIPRLIPKNYLRKKIKAYRDNNIFCFPGGLFAELALAQGNYDKFLAEAVEMGFSGIEVSDNLLTISPEDKAAAIKKAVDQYGLTVMGEVGKKDGVMTRDEIIADVENCLGAGAKLVLLEAHELFHGDIRLDDIEALAAKVPMERVMFELPVTKLPDVPHHYKIEVLFWLVRQFGGQVNLANVEWDEIYFTETSRMGASGDRGPADGAYAKAGVND
jgi:phosphosulfolactate synthase